MSSRRICVRLSRELFRRLRGYCKLRQQPQSAVVRKALETFLAAKPRQSAYATATKLGLIRCAPGLPKDLSTNRRYLKGFGRSN